MGKRELKDFPKAERGKVKSAYCRRKDISDVMVKSGNVDHAGESTDNEVYDCYNRVLSFSTILLKIKCP